MVECKYSVQWGNGRNGETIPACTLNSKRERIAFCAHDLPYIANTMMAHNLQTNPQIDSELTSDCGCHEIAVVTTTSLKEQVIATKHISPRMHASPREWA